LFGPLLTGQPADRPTETDFLSSNERSALILAVLYYSAAGHHTVQWCPPHSVRRRLHGVALHPMRQRVHQQHLNAPCLIMKHKKLAGDFTRANVIEVSSTLLATRRLVYYPTCKLAQWNW